MGSETMGGLGNRQLGGDEGLASDGRGLRPLLLFSRLNLDCRQLSLGEQDSQWPRSLAAALAVFWIIIYLAFRTWEIRFYSLDYDELFSVTAAKMSFRGLLVFIANDIVHPPGFYILLKSWIALGGDSLVWLRLFPFLASALLPLPLILLCRELRLRSGSTVIVLMLTACNSVQIFYSNIVRMYSLVLLLAVLVMWLFVRWFNFPGAANKRLLSALILANAAMVWTHYYCWFIVLIEFLFLLMQPRKFKQTAVWLALLGISYVPWVLQVARAASRHHGLHDNIAWVAPPNFRDLAWFIAQMNGTFDFPHSTTISVLMFLIPTLLVGAMVLRKSVKLTNPEGTGVAFLALSVALPVLLVIIACYVFGVRVWSDRYLIYVSIPFSIFEGFVFSRIQPLRLRAVAIAGLVVWTTFSPLLYFTDHERRFHFDALARRIAEENSWRGDEPIYVFEKFVLVPLEREVDTRTPGRHQFELIDDLSHVIAEKSWVAVRTKQPGDELKAPKVLAASGYVVGHPGTIRAFGQILSVFPVSRKSVEPSAPTAAVSPGQSH